MVVGCPQQGGFNAICQAIWLLSDYHAKESHDAGFRHWYAGAWNIRVQLTPLLPWTAAVAAARAKPAAATAPAELALGSAPAGAASEAADVAREAPTGAMSVPALRPQLTGHQSVLSQATLDLVTF